MNIEKYAMELGVNLYKEYTAKDGAKAIRVGVNTLSQAASDNAIDFIQTGKRNKKFLGVQLIKWKLSNIKSANSISLRTEAVHGVEPGMTQKPNKERLQALALETFKPLKSA